MAADETPTTHPLTGFMIPANLTYWPEESTVTEAGPYPGVAVPHVTSKMEVVASGTPAADKTLQVRAQDGGLAALGSANFTWKSSTDTLYRGHDFPHNVTHFAAPSWQTGANLGRLWWSIETTPTDAIIAATTYSIVTGGSEERSVKVWRRTTAGVWSEQTIHTEADPFIGAAHSFLLHPEIVVLPDGTLEIYHWTHDHTAERAQIAKHVSTDDGVTWFQVSSGVLEDSIDTELTPRVVTYDIRVSYHGGQHLMVVYTNRSGGTTKNLTQYASRDGGYSFQRIAALVGAGYEQPRVASVQGMFLITYIDVTSADLRVVTLGSAYTPIDDANGADVRTGTVLENMAILGDETGRIYVYARELMDMLLIVSDDNGATWSDGLGGGPPPQNNAPGTATLNNADATWWRGQVIMASNNSDATGPHSFLATHLGGYSDVTLPLTVQVADTTNGIARQSSWNHYFLPYSDLHTNATNWALTTAGTAVLTIDGKLRFSKTGVDTREYTYGDAAGAMLPIIGKMVVDGSGTDAEAALRMRTSDITTDSWNVEVRYIPGTGTLVLYDVQGAAAKVTLTGAVANDSRVDILVGIAPGTTGAGDGRAAFWYRVDDDSNEDRQYTYGGATTTLANAGAYAPGDECKFFYRNTTGTGVIDLHGLGVMLGSPQGVSNDRTIIGEGMAVARANPGDLRGRSFSTQPVYVSDGISVRSRGIVHGGTQYTIEPRHTYEVEKVLPSVEPSPSRGWRSTGTAESALAFRLNADSRDDYSGSDLWAVYVGETNSRRIKVEVRRSAAWTTLGTFSAAQTSNYVRQGNVVIPSQTGSTTGAEHYVQRDELRGCQYRLAAGEIRKIVSNTPGTIHIHQSSTIAEYRFSAILDGVLGGDTVGPATGEIWRRDTVILLNLQGLNDFEGVRITLNLAADDNPSEGYTECGILAMGPVQSIGETPDNTRSVARDLSGDVVTYQPDGSAVREELSPQFRRVELSWARSTRITPFQHQAAERPWVRAWTGGTSEPSGNRYGAVLDFDGILRQAGRSPIVYLPVIDPTKITAVHNRRTGKAGGAIYGRFVPGSYRIETVRGYAERDETVRSSVVTIQEEV